MKSEETRFYEVEAFLRNELSPEAAADFAAEMATDPALRQQVAAQRAQQKAEEFLIEDDLRASIQSWKTELDAEEPSPAPAGKPRRFPLWAILGTAITALVFTWFWMSKPETLTPPETAAPPETPIATEGQPAKTPEEQPASPQENVPPNKQTPKSNLEQSPATNNYLAIATRFEEVPAFAGEGVRTGAPSTENAFEKGMESLGRKEYEKAAAFFREVKADDEHWSDAQYNLGSLLYLQKKYKQAIPFLKTAAENPDFLYGDNARWYWALCLLASGKIEEARVHLDQLLTQPKGDFFKKAQELRKEIKQ